MTVTDFQDFNEPSDVVEQRPAVYVMTGVLLDCKRLLIQSPGNFAATTARRKRRLGQRLAVSVRRSVSANQPRT